MASSRSFRSMKTRLPVIADVFVVLLLLVCSVGVIQGADGEVPPTGLPAPGAAVNELSVEVLQGKIKKLDVVPDLDPAIKSKLVESYNQAIEQLRAAAELAARGDQFSKLTRESPDALKAIQTEMNLPPEVLKPDLPAEPTLAQVQQQLSQAEMKLADTQKAMQTLLDEPKRQADRRLEIPKRADAIKALIQEIDTQLNAEPAADEPADITAANRMVLESRKKTLNAEVAMSQLELQYYEATGELLSAQRDRAARQISSQDALVKDLRTQVNDRRLKEAEEQARQAREAAAEAHPAVKKIAEANATLATLRKTLAGKIEQVSRDLDAVDAQITTLDDQFKKIQNRINTVGETQAMGLLLRKQRDELPSLKNTERVSNNGTSEISNTYLQLIEYEESRNDLATLDSHVTTAIESVGEPVSLDELSFLESKVREALAAQRVVYDSLISDTKSYVDKLVDLDVRQRQLISTARNVEEYCDERILWIRSTTSFGMEHLRQLVPSLNWLTTPQSWIAVGKALWSDAMAHPTLTIYMGLLFVLLILIQRPLRARIALLGEQASRSNMTSFVPTARTFVMTTLISILWPGLLAYLGFRLRAVDEPSDFVLAIGRAVLTSSVLLGTLEFFRNVCRGMGLGQAHFGWDINSLRLVRRTQWLFIAMALPLIFIVVVSESQSNEFIKSSLGRVAFLGALIVLAFCTHRLTHPETGALSPLYKESPMGWGTRLQRVWYLLSLGVPLVLGVLSLSGYHYTSIQLAWRLLVTTWLMTGTLIVYSSLIRWSLLSYREIAMRNARERREAEASAAAVEGATPPPAVVISKAQQVTALSDINKQTRKALQLAYFVGVMAGLWLIWADVLPALGALRHITVWDIDTTVKNGAIEQSIKQPVSLAALLLSILIASLTFAASRNLPSLLEIALLQRLPIDPGARYAITTVCKYAITIAGLVIAFGTVGIGWSRVQWLVAAISVGLGFGLQEIFANFVSGLILLLERPVRLGDIVTVGDATGNVTQIQMRATTITDWELREIVIPNRELITGRVMNWTLSSTVSRMAVQVGVAYGSDPEQVRTILLDVATRHPLVLNTPPPHALFDEFGESSLNFILRVYMSTRDVYLQLRHSLMVEILAEFQKAQIEIAFPQRDIHIREEVASSAIARTTPRNAPKPADG